MELADARTSADFPKLKPMWKELLDFSTQLKSTKSLGKPVPSSFSIKVQRKLASTVPPRPIVEVGPEAAYNHFEGLCRDGSIVTEVMTYYDSHSLLVSHTSRSYCTLPTSSRHSYLSFKRESHCPQSTSGPCCSTISSVI